MGNIIQREKSIIPACDVPLEVYEHLLRQTFDIDGVGAYKVGFELGLRYGLQTVVELTRRYTHKPIIYDHQKAGTDIPDTGEAFAKVMKDSGIDAIILFPQAGPETQKAWTQAALARGLGVLVGGEMTHPKYKRSEGGYIADEALEEMYVNGADQGVIDFVVPGNRIQRIGFYRELIEGKGIAPTFFAPGFVAQGGAISDAAQVAGKSWHAIVGRGIYGDVKKLGRYFTEKEIRDAVLEHTRQL